MVDSIQHEVSAIKRDLLLLLPCLQKDLENLQAKLERGGGTVTAKDYGGLQETYRLCDRLVAFSTLQENMEALGGSEPSRLLHDLRGHLLGKVADAFNRTAPEDMDVEFVMSDSDACLQVSGPWGLRYVETEEEGDEISVEFEGKSLGSTMQIHLETWRLGRSEEAEKACVVDAQFLQAILRNAMIAKRRP